MCADQPPLMQLATALADGERVDWVDAESSAATPEEQRMIEQLRVVAKLAAVHRGPAGQPAPEQATLAPRPVPSHWGSLELRHEIGHGTSGAVYLAWDPALERDVALKILRKTGASTAVIQEGRLLAKVRHPNVVAVYGVDEFDGEVGFWMELVQGLTLKQVLATHGVLGAQEAAVIGIDVCRAVSAVHKAGLLHRDIKAQNVMREAGGRIVLMDFGAGEVRAEGAGSSRRTIGTPLYFSPELFDGAPASIASDVYSIGVLLYHLVTLRYPVEGNTMDAVEAAHATGRRTPVTDVRPDLPPLFARVIERALEPDPARRCRSVGAMQQDLAAVLELATDAVPQTVRQVAAANRLRTPSVAVLPFDNLGPEKDIEYFCNGLAEELLTALGKVQGLRVASRTSSFSVKGTGVDAKSMCQQLDVSAMLEGTVRKAGDRLRITAQLVSAEDGCHLWSDGYDQQMADVFAVQDIAHSVVDRLKVTFAGFPQPLIRRYTDSPRAYESYLQGRHYWSRRYHGGLRTALQHFEKAIQEDAGYAQAHAGLADAYAFIGFYVLEPPRAAFAQALAAVEHALRIEPNLPEAHTSLALIKLGNNWDFQGAEREFKHALELDPNQPLPLIYLSWISIMQGRHDIGVDQARTAREMEPLSPLVNSGAAYTLFMSGEHYKEAVAYCDKALEKDPNFIVAIYVKSMCRAVQSELPEAIELIERAVSMSDRAPFYLGILGNCYGRAGATARAHAVLDELDQLSKHRYVTPHSQSYIYSGLNDLDRAFEWQARNFEDGSAPFPYYSPMIDNLRTDPRHAAELQRMRLRT
jgi:TolB-like protein